MHPMRASGQGEVVGFLAGIGLHATIGAGAVVGVARQNLAVPMQDQILSRLVVDQAREPVAFTRPQPRFAIWPRDAKDCCRLAQHLDLARGDGQAGGRGCQGQTGQGGQQG